jgi:hypothetical protein
VWLGIVAGAVGGMVSGVPSTLHAVARGSDPLAATRAAGSLLGRPGIGRGVVAHAALSLGWGVALASLGRPESLGRAVGRGALAGAGIAAFDLGLVGRYVPEIEALATTPQVLDHLVFGAVVCAVVWHCQEDLFCARERRAQRPY